MEHEACPKCGKPKQPESPDSCLMCGAIYAKVEEHIKRTQLAKQKQLRDNEEKEKKAEQALKKEIDKRLSKSSICTQCGYFGQPAKLTKGSIIIEIILWAPLIGLFFISSFFPALGGAIAIFGSWIIIIPALIYSIWRLSSKYKACPECKHPSMIPANSPKGRKLIKEANQ